MTFTKPTVNQRLTALIIGLQSDLKGLFNNDMINRRRLDFIEIDMARLCEKVGIEMTVPKDLEPETPVDEVKE
tara:strand:- start:73 stop:291 length:219 start_codon:yes stop_codon:yes gene_type:complete